MRENLVRKRRQARGLTQRGLADLVGTSQQQIQRVEAGIQGVRLELAVEIAKALDVALPEVFPGLVRNTKRRSSEKLKPKLALKEFVDAGIDPDPRQWAVRFGLRNGQEVTYEVSSGEKERISDILWKSQFEFLVFDSTDNCVAVRRDGINFCEFIDDDYSPSEKQIREQKYKLDVFFIDGGGKSYRIEADDVDLLEDDSFVDSQMQRLLIDLDGDVNTDDEVVSFYDEDGVQVFIRRKQILRLEVPLICCQPSLLNSCSDDLEGNQNTRTLAHGQKESEL
jgi:transcriptional regulator with XRE-family HTH domain